MDALLKFARSHFVLSRPDKNTGKTRLQQLEDIRIQTGVVAPELVSGPELPEAGIYLWRWFLDLCRARPQGASAVVPLLWSEVEAYFRLAGIRPRPWEIEIVKALDIAFVETMNDDKRSVSSAGAFSQTRNDRRAEQLQRLTNG